MNGDIEIFDQPKQPTIKNSGDKKIRKRTIYAIMYGIGGLAIGYFVHSLSLVLAWLFIFGDGPTSAGQDMISYIFIYGTTISFWLLVVRFGYHQGVEAENSPSQKPSISVFKIFLKVILAIVVMAVILIPVIAWNAYHVTQKSNTTANSSTNSPSTNPDQQRYDIMNWMTSAWASGRDCVGGKKDVLSGNGGDMICDIPGRTWPVIKVCGANPSDTKWVVTDGSGQEKNITLNCKEVTSCNGQINASCDVNGINACKFNKGCDPRKK